MQENPAPPSKPVFREFTDSRGTHWRIWQVNPSDTARGVPLSPRRRVPARPALADHTARETRREEWAQGWLLFESPETKKRLFPIPDGWTTASVGALEAMCESATPVR